MKTITKQNETTEMVFSAEELVEIACTAVDMLDIKVATLHNADGWTLNESDCEFGSGEFDYCCDGRITLEAMTKWDALRKWCEERFACPMTLFIGSRGDFEDVYDTYCITPTENLIQQDIVRKKMHADCQKNAAKCILSRYERNKKRREVEIASKTTLGDIDALEQLKAKMEKGE